MILSIENLGFSYGSKNVFRGVSTRLEPGRVLCVCGPNGAGKTTLLKCVTGILVPSTGTVRIDGLPFSLMSRKQLAAKIAYVPQNLPARFPVSVFETVLAGRRPHMSWRPSGRDLDMTASILVEMGLSDLAMRDMDRLSGGQVQKVLLARALVQETPLLVLDEPTSNLDLRHQLEIMELIEKLVEEKSLGVIMAIHDLNLAARFSDTIMMLENGRLHFQGAPAEAITPANIREVYGIEADVTRLNGHINVQPLNSTASPAAPAKLEEVS